ncbi:MAG: hypothetical protein ACKOWH_05335 [Rhodoluna sp.]
MREIGGWGWFWIWATLVVGSLALFGFIAKSLFNRASAVAHQLSRLLKKAAILSDLANQAMTLDKPESSMNRDPKTVQAERRTLLKAKDKKKEQRQRRLIASLKKYDPNESRFR